MFCNAILVDDVSHHKLIQRGRDQADVLDIVDYDPTGAKSVIAPRDHPAKVGRVGDQAPIVLPALRLKVYGWL
jgi:hypothetical protein